MNPSNFSNSVMMALTGQGHSERRTQGGTRKLRKNRTAMEENAEGSTGNEADEEMSERGSDAFTAPTLPFSPPLAFSSACLTSWRASRSSRQLHPQMRASPGTDARK